MDADAAPNLRQRALSHREYLDSLHTPFAGETRRISEIQSQKERKILAKYNTEQSYDAARVIQSAYRGHRQRRQLNGLTVDISSRWVDAIKEWRYRNAVAPHRRLSSPERQILPQSTSEAARANWRRAGEIAEHAVASDLASSGPLPSHSFSLKQTQAPRRELAPPDSMLLDLRYFLEMIDMKHRYGANLQVYHEAWRGSDTNQNFFFWLDHGAGRHEDLVGCSRAKLEKERIRYLSKEERRHYLVCVDEIGLLRWAKNDELVTTSVDHYQDSAHGIVSKGSTDLAPSSDVIQQTYSADVTLTTKVTAVGGLFRDTILSDSASQYADDSSSSTSSSSSPAHAGDDQVHQDGRQQKKARRKLFVSPATILNHLLRASVRPGTWIYVADTVGRLYIGIKSSGAFQNASFLSGARISSAGIIGIEEGKLKYLSPLSGHYRPTTKSFRAFIASLKSQQVDMSSLKVSKAYAVLLGMEVYGKSKRDIRKVKHAHDEVKREERRKRKASRASVEKPNAALVDEPVSAMEQVEQRWHQEHERHGLARAMDDLYLKRVDEKLGER